MSKPKLYASDEQLYYQGYYGHYGEAGEASDEEILSQPCVVAALQDAYTRGGRDAAESFEKDILQHEKVQEALRKMQRTAYAFVFNKGSQAEAEWRAGGGRGTTRSYRREYVHRTETEARLLEPYAKEFLAEVLLDGPIGADGKYTFRILRLVE